MWQMSWADNVKLKSSSLACQETQDRISTILQKLTKPEELLKKEHTKWDTATFWHNSLKRQEANWTSCNNLTTLENNTDIHHTVASLHK